MKTKLITALRTCANALEQGTFEYNWLQPESCNCGVVACALMGKSVAEMEELIAPMRVQVDLPNWKFLVGKFCPVTGIPQNEVFRALLESGMSQTDIIELETLSNPKVLERVNLYEACRTTTRTPNFIGRLFGKKPRKFKEKVNGYTLKDNAVIYLRAWADLLTEEGALDVTDLETKDLELQTK